MLVPQLHQFYSRHTAVQPECSFYMHAITVYVTWHFCMLPVYMVQDCLNNLLMNQIPLTGKQRDPLDIVSWLGLFEEKSKVQAAARKLVLISGCSGRPHTEAGRHSQIMESISMFAYKDSRSQIALQSLLWNSQWLIQLDLVIQLKVICGRKWYFYNQ